MQELNALIKNINTKVKKYLKSDTIQHTTPHLATQVQNIRQAEIAKEMDKSKGKADGQFKKDLAGDKHQGFVQIARRIARTLAVNGPISIDDVTMEMAKLHNVLPEKGKRKHQWKGAVFNKSEWRYIGDVPSAQKAAHGRPVGLWALKTWLKTNSLNGKSTRISSFVLSKLFTDFNRTHGGGADFSNCMCYIGNKQLSDDIKTTIVNGNNNIYGMPVTFCPNAVGALMIEIDPMLQLRSQTSTWQ